MNLGLLSAPRAPLSFFLLDDCAIQTWMAQSPNGPPATPPIPETPPEVPTELPPEIEDPPVFPEQPPIQEPPQTPGKIIAACVCVDAIAPTFAGGGVAVSKGLTWPALMGCGRQPRLTSHLWAIAPR